MNLLTSSLQKARTLVARSGLRSGIAEAVRRWARSRTSVPSDVMGEYAWILGPNRPAVLPAPRTGPLKINWLLPFVVKGSGGLLNIFRTIHNLEKWGHENRVYVLDWDAATGSHAEELVRSFYFPFKAQLEPLTPKIADSDALIATMWTTAYAARAVANTAGKFYFVQDLEYLFYPAGSLQEFAKQTYKFGFHGITLGPWIADTLRAEFGMECSPFGFSYDREVYSPNGRPGIREQRKRVLYYARPRTDRRGFELGILTLSLVAKKRPDVEFVLVGFSPRKMHIPFRTVFPGVLSPAELADLPPVLTPADIAAAMMEFLADDTLAGRIMVCRGGEPSHLIPLIDEQAI